MKVLTLEEKRWWLWQVPEKAKYIGKRGLPRKDARDKASGRALYCRDICLPGMVYAKSLNSPFTHAKIKSMDTSRAEKLPGVLYVLRWDDPEIKWPPAPTSSMRPRLLAPYLSPMAEFYGTAVGAIVVAEDEETCDEALKILMEDTEWEEYPFILDWEEALKKGVEEMMAPVNWEFGNVEEGFKQADRVIEFTVRKSEEDTWAGVEGGVAVAAWQGDRVEIWHYGHGPFGVKTILSQFYGIPESNIIVHAPYHGALFGGITWLGYPDALAAIAALLARKLKRPVKILDDYTCFRGAEWQLGTYKFKVGFKNDGTITAVKLETVLVGQPLPEHSLVKLLKSTKIPNMAIHAVWPKVNRPHRMCYRHGSQHCNVVVYVINRVAAELGMDPTEVALKNDGWHGHSMEWINEHIKPAEGFPKRDSLKEVIEIGKKAIGWDEKWHPPGAKRLPNGKYHGIGFMAVEQWAWVPFTVGNFPRPISAGIKVNKDGSIEILGWRSDGGTAFSTAYCQVVADEIGVPYESVFHSHFEDHGFVLWQMGGSAGVVSNLIPIIAAARKVKQMILEYATQLLGSFNGKKPEELDIEDGFVFEKANPENKVHISEVARRITIFASADLYDYIEAIANRKSSEVYKGPASFQPRTFELIEPYAKPNLIRQAHFVEVEVDPETGKIDVTNVVVVNDVGRAINPDAINGQQYGGAYMGLARNHMEAIYYDPLTGVRLNDNLLGYCVPLMNDIGKIDCHIVETGMAYGPYGMAGCSEALGAALSMVLGPAVYNAIGKWIDDFPITPDKVLKALGKA